MPEVHSAEVGLRYEHPSVVALQRDPLPSGGRMISGIVSQLSKYCPRIQVPSLLERWSCEVVQESPGSSKPV